MPFLAHSFNRQSYHYIHSFRNKHSELNRPILLPEPIRFTSHLVRAFGPACPRIYIRPRQRLFQTTSQTNMPFTLLNDHTLHYTDLPPDSGDAKLTLVFVHGLGSSQNYYYPILPALTARGYRCIVFDNYLAGRSFREDEWKAQPETSVKVIATDVLGLMDRLRVQTGVVVGYSMGGMLPTYLAATAPERVVAGICIGPVHPSEQVAEVFKARVPVVQNGTFIR
jgi:alpha-beta hydrolase superfamily lysophospholipase